MPIMMELRLKTGWPASPGTRQVHGLACALFEGDGAAHSGNGKPFAVWPVSPAPPGSAHDWEWRAAWLPGTQPPAGVLDASSLRLGHVTWAVSEAVHRRASHAELASGPPLASAVAAFRSPAYFSQNGEDVIVPDPRLIAGSWRRRWNASLPDGHALAIGDDAWRELHRALRLTAFDLRSELLDGGHGHDRAGFTGSATLRLARDAPHAARAAFGALARFAEFCGTGAQTTHGFGATTVSAEPPGL